MTRPGNGPAMQSALDLARKHPALPVKDICEIAGVSRTAFYKAKKQEPDRCPHCKRIMSRWEKP